MNSDPKLKKCSHCHEKKECRRTIFDGEYICDECFAPLLEWFMEVED